MILILFLIKLFTGTNVHKTHAFHISKTEIEVNKNENTLNFTTHFFIDDFERTLTQSGRQGLNLCSDKEIKPQGDSAVFNYISTHFLVSINGKNYPIQWVGKERAKDYQAMYVYYTIAKVKNIKSIELKTTLLTETFSDQKNIVELKATNLKDGFIIFDKNHNSETIKF